MGIHERVSCYREIEVLRGRPLVSYVTSTRAGVGAQVAPDTVRELIDQLDAIDQRDGIDVLLHSAGGDALAAWKLMSVLREQFKHVAVLVPSTAFSAATLFALGADEIYMHSHASLGPIDPQITVRGVDGKVRQFAYEDVGAFLKFLTDEVHLNDQAHFAALAEKLLSTVDPLVVGAARRASDLSAEVGARLLMMHMKDAEKAREIAQNLNKSFFAHGDAVSRSRAKELRLQVVDVPRELERLMWRAYLGWEEHLKLREPFHPHIELMSDDRAAEQLRPSAPLAIPPNTPPQLAQQAFDAALNLALQKSVAGAATVPYELVNALLESPRLASEFRSRGHLTGFRRPDGQIQVTATDTESGWRRVDVPAEPDGEAVVAD